jgi:hypothetical protein
MGVVLFLLGVFCQGFLFWRGWRWRGWSIYPFFYAYLSYTTFWTFVLISFPHAHPLYPRVYWDSELGATVLRLLVAWEILRGVFNRGVIRKIAGTAIVVLIVLLALAFWLSGPSPSVSPIADFMRRMALSEGLWTILVFGLAWFYGIQIGKNIWGMAVGFLIFVSSEITNLAAFDLASWFTPIWRFLHPFAYIFMLAVWTWALWDYAPNPHNEIDTSLGSRLLSTWKRRSTALEESIRKVTQP